VGGVALGGEQGGGAQQPWTARREKSRAAATAADKDAIGSYLAELVLFLMMRCRTALGIYSVEHGMIREGVADGGGSVVDEEP
jgi:hypothetical protein